MDLLLVSVAILGLLSIGHSAPVTSCESLTQRINIESRDQLLGKWIYLAESLNIPGARTVTKMYLDSVFINITAGPDSDSVKYYQAQKMLGKCVSFSDTVLVANNTIHLTKPYKATEVLLTTSCPDCMVILSNLTLGSTYYQGLQLIGKRRQLTTAEQDEFKKQAECLNLQSPVFMNPLNELCTGEVGQDTESTDLTSVINSEAVVEMARMLESVINSDSGLIGFFNNVFTNMEKENEN